MIIGAVFRLVFVSGILAILGASPGLIGAVLIVGSVLMSVGVLNWWLRRRERVWAECELSCKARRVLDLLGCSRLSTAGEWGLCDSSGSTCVICLGDFAPSDPVRGLGCGHAFHDECICGWLHESTRCPTCRAEIAPITETQADLEGSTDASVAEEGGRILAL